MNWLTYIGQIREEARTQKYLMGKRKHLDGIIKAENLL